MIANSQGWANDALHVSWQHEIPRIWGPNTRCHNLFRGAKPVTNKIWNVGWARLQKLVISTKNVVKLEIPQKLLKQY